MRGAAAAAPAPRAPEDERAGRLRAPVARRLSSRTAYIAMLGRRTYACRRAIAAPMSSPAALRWLGSNSAATELEYMRRACQVQRWHCQRRSFGRTPDGRSPSVREVTLREAAGLEPRPPWWPKPSQRKPRPSPRVQQSRTVPTGIQEDGSTPGPAPAPAPAPERVAKRLARVGLCSRREADEWITAGTCRAQWPRLLWLVPHHTSRHHTSMRIRIPCLPFFRARFWMR